MDVSEHLHIILRRWWQIALAALLIAGSVFAWRNSVASTYASTALVRVVVADDQRADASLSEQNVDFAGRSFAQLANTRSVAADAAARAGLALSAADVQSRVSVDSSTTGYLAVRATASSPDNAAKLTNGAAEALIKAVADQGQHQRTQLIAPAQAQIDTLQKELAAASAGDARRAALETQYDALLQSATQLSLRPLDRLDLVTSAQPVEQPVAPHPVRDALLAFLLGVIVASELAVLLTVIRDRYPRDDIANAVTRDTGLPVVGEIPDDGTDEDLTEAVRSLRTTVMFMEAIESRHSLAIVGGEARIGKSFVAVNLANSITEIDYPVRLVDGDIRRPTLHRYLDRAQAPGLSDVLAGATGVHATPVIGRPGLEFLPAGASATHDPAGMFASPQFKADVLTTERNDGLVIIDTPPLGLFADALTIAAQADAVLLVIDATRSRRRRLRRTLQLLGQLGVRPIGVVINRTRTERVSSYYRSAKERADRETAVSGRLLRAPR